VKLIHYCMAFKITIEEINFICDGFQDWVIEYEKYVTMVAY